MSFYARHMIYTATATRRYRRLCRSAFIVGWHNPSWQVTYRDLLCDLHHAKDRAQTVSARTQASEIRPRQTHCRCAELWARTSLDTSTRSLCHGAAPQPHHAPRAPHMLTMLLTHAIATSRIPRLGVPDWLGDPETRIWDPNLSPPTGILRALDAALRGSGPLAAAQRGSGGSHPLPWRGSRRGSLRRLSPQP